MDTEVKPTHQGAGLYDDEKPPHRMSPLASSTQEGDAIKTSGGTAASPICAGDNADIPGGLASTISGATPSPIGGTDRPTTVTQQRQPPGGSSNSDNMTDQSQKPFSAINVDEKDEDM